MGLKQAVLVAVPAEEDRSLLVQALEPEYEVLQAENGRQALALLQVESSRVCAVVLELSEPDGCDLLRRISRMRTLQGVPLLVSMEEECAETEDRCLELGVYGFLHKPYQPSAVRLRLKNAIRHSRPFLTERLRHLTEHDQLTGLYNRGTFFEAVRQSLRRSPEQRFVMVRMDVDRFRLVNSFFGEEEGNNLLRYIARQLTGIAASRPYMLYGRVGADVFCVWDRYEEACSQALLDQVRDLLQSYARKYYVELSAGFYIVEDNGLDVETIYARASMAAEQCKGHYGQYCAYYNAALSEETFRTQFILNGMETALRERQFQVYLQPKYDLRTERPCGAEALVRWMHPEKGMISPAEFVPVFERNGFITRVDDYVWEETCRLLRRWIDQGRDPDPISVNVSRVNAYNPGLVEDLTRLVKAYRLPPHLLQLEVTESAFMDSPELLRETLARLRRSGFVVLLDDFGSGYSSLNTLRDIQVDILKIDMDFLPRGGADSRSRRILASVIRMAGELEMPVIMEGVETREQREFLLEAGCGYVQGYLYAKPMTVAEYEALVEASGAETR